MGASNSKAAEVAEPRRPLCVFTFDSLDESILCTILCKLPLREHQRAAVLNKRMVALVGSGEGASRSFTFLKELDVSQRSHGDRPLRDDDAKRVLSKCAILRMLRLSDDVLGRALSLSDALRALSASQKAALLHIDCTGVRERESCSAIHELELAETQCTSLVRIDTSVQQYGIEQHLARFEALTARWPALRVERSIPLFPNAQACVDVATKSRLHALCARPHLDVGRMVEGEPDTPVIASLLANKTESACLIEDDFDEGIPVDILVALNSGCITHVTVDSKLLAYVMHLCPLLASRLTHIHVHVVPDAFVDEELSRVSLTSAVVNTCADILQHMPKLQDLTIEFCGVHGHRFAGPLTDWRPVVFALEQTPHLVGFSLLNIAVDKDGVDAVTRAISSRRRKEKTHRFRRLERLSLDVLGHLDEHRPAVIAAIELLHSDHGLREVSLGVSKRSLGWQASLVDHFLTTVLDGRLKLERLAIAYQSTLGLQDLAHEVTDEKLETWLAIMKLLLLSRRLEVPGCAQVELGRRLSDHGDEW